MWAGKAGIRASKARSPLSSSTRSSSVYSREFIILAPILGT